MATRTALSILLSAGLLAGCSLGLGVRLEGGSSPRHFLPGPDARVVVSQALHLEPRQLRAYFQGGRQLPHAQVNPHYPNCHLEFDRIGDMERTIPPGRYAVVRTERRHAPLASLEPVRVAALGLPLEMAMWQGGGSPTINFETRFHLKPIEGGAQDIRSLNCAQWGEPGSVDTYPTHEEIERALGAAARLEL